MKKTFTFAAVLLAVGTMPVLASPTTNPVHAADTGSGTGCIVRGSETDLYRFDAACTFHTVTKRNKDGSLKWFRYQDKGTLQPGNVVPENGTQIAITNGPNCVGKEVVAPSGQYSSDLLCTYP